MTHPFSDARAAFAALVLSSCSFKPVFGAYGILTLLEPGKALFIWHSSFLYIDPVRGSYAESAPAHSNEVMARHLMRTVIHWSTRKKETVAKSVPAPGRKFLYRQGSCVAVYVNGFSLVTQRRGWRGHPGKQTPPPHGSRSKVLLLSTLPAYSAISRYRNVTIWARVQERPGRTSSRWCRW